MNRHLLGRPIKIGDDDYDQDFQRGLKLLAWNGF
jgi:hypothetical protein